MTGKPHTAAPRGVEWVPEAVHIIADQEAKKKTESGARFCLQRPTPSDPLPPARPHLQKVYTQELKHGLLETSSPAGTMCSKHESVGNMRLKPRQKFLLSPPERGENRPAAP